MRLLNGGFEEMWNGSRRCVMIDGQGNAHIVDIGNIECPTGWAVWFRSEGANWRQPEGRLTTAVDPQRMRTGHRGYQLFKTYGNHDSGLMQVVGTEAGERLVVTAFAHAWSNHYDKNLPDKFPHPDDAKWSEGAGYEPYFVMEGHTENDALRNFTFQIGIDPDGGIDPFAESVVWGYGAHISKLAFSLEINYIVGQERDKVLSGQRVFFYPFRLF